MSKISQYPIVTTMNAGDYFLIDTTPITSTSTSIITKANAVPGNTQGSFTASGILKQTQYNVFDYGAVGNGSHDDTTAIQNAINDAHTALGGVVFFPQGTYKITAALTIYTGVTLQGVGEETSIISQATTTVNGVTGVDVSSVGLRDIYIKGPSSGTGVGVALSWSGAGNVPYSNFTNVLVEHFGSDGIAIETPIVSNFTKVVSANNGGYGFNWYHAGTSCTFNDCYANNNSGVAGYRFFQSVYQSLNGCASDNNAIGYLIDGAQGIALSGCGAESCTTAGVKVTNSSDITLTACWNYNNTAIAYWVTGSSLGIELFACTENTPGGGATASFKVDAGSRALLSAPKNTTATSLATGTTTVIDDVSSQITVPGTAYFTGPSVRVTGSSGTMILNSNTDGGNYNINVDTTGTLAFFGSGPQTLHVNLLDGNLYMSSNLTISNGGVLTNVTLDSAGTGNTLKVNGTSLTAVTGTGSVVLATTPTLVTPVIGVATGTSLAVTGALSSSGTAGVGYATGAGGAVTQITSRTTGVILNKITGAITLFSAAGSATPASFTVTNSTVAATDVIHVCQKSGTDLWEIFVTNVAAGSFQITMFTTGGTTTEQPVFNFAVIKGVTS